MRCKRLGKYRLATLGRAPAPIRYVSRMTRFPSRPRGAGVCLGRAGNTGRADRRRASGSGRRGPPGRSASSAGRGRASASRPEPARHASSARRSPFAACPTGTAARTRAGSTAAASPSMFRAQRHRAAALRRGTVRRGQEVKPRDLELGRPGVLQDHFARPFARRHRHRRRPVRPRAELEGRRARRAPQRRLLVEAVHRRAAPGLG